MEAPGCAGGSLLDYSIMIRRPLDESMPRSPTPPVFQLVRCGRSQGCRCAPTLGWNWQTPLALIPGTNTSGIRRFAVSVSQGCKQPWAEIGEHLRRNSGCVHFSMPGNSAEQVCHRKTTKFSNPSGWKSRLIASLTQVSNQEAGFC